LGNHWRTFFYAIGVPGNMAMERTVSGLRRVPGSGGSPVMNQRTKNSTKKNPLTLR
jgi:hypothetical protein